MKIAFITDDGKTISRHFGRAGHYLVVEIENGEEVSREMRDKLGHQNFTQSGEHHDHDHHDHDHHEQGAHAGAGAHGKHMSMAEAIGDCQVLVCGGMGMGAYQSMQQLGITPIVTQESDIDAALSAYLSGDLKDHTEMLH